jgi:hypothetical protein
MLRQKNFKMFRGFESLFFRTSNDNWFVPHQGYYYFSYNAQSGAARPTVPMFIKFKGESNMRAFTKKFGFEFSGITR